MTVLDYCCEILEYGRPETYNPQPIDFYLVAVAGVMILSAGILAFVKAK